MCRLLLAVFSVATIYFQSSGAYDIDINQLRDPVVKQLADYLVNFPKNAAQSWTSYSEYLLRASDAGDSLLLFADQLNNYGVSGSCVNQLKQDYTFLKNSIVQNYQVCVDKYPLPAASYDAGINTALASLGEMDDGIQRLVGQCNGMTRERCEASNPSGFMELRTKGRKSAMVVYRTAVDSFDQNGKEVTDCLLESNIDVSRQLYKDFDLLYQCLNES